MRFLLAFLIHTTWAMAMLPLLACPPLPRSTTRPPPARPRTRRSARSVPPWCRVRGVLPAPGVVNSLQVLSIPRSTTESWAWLKEKAENSGVKSTDTTENIEKRKSNSLVVVAALGQEPRLGRWIVMKGDGAQNATRTFVIHQKTPWLCVVRYHPYCTVRESYIPMHILDYV